MTEKKCWHDKVCPMRVFMDEFIKDLKSSAAALRQQNADENGEGRVPRDIAIVKMNKAIELYEEKF